MVWAGVWPWSTTVACVIHWRQQGGGPGLGTACAVVMAGQRGGARRSTSVPVPGVAYVPLDLLQKNGKAGWMLTEARTRAV